MLTPQKLLERYFSSPLTSWRRRASTKTYSLRFTHRYQLKTKRPLLGQSGKGDWDERVTGHSPEGDTDDVNPFSEHSHVVGIGGTKEKLSSI